MRDLFADSSKCRDSSTPSNMIGWAVDPSRTAGYSKIERRLYYRV